MLHRLFVVLFMSLSEKTSVLYQVLLAFPAALDRQVQLDHLDPPVEPALPVLLAILVFQEIQEDRVIQEFQVHRVFQELLAQLVNSYY